MFIILITVPNIIFLLPSDTVNIENRVLAEKPKLNIAMLQDYPEQYTVYYEDNLPLKATMIKANSWFKFHVLNKSPQNYVIKGKDGWLFYNSIYKNEGDNMVDYQGISYYTEEQEKKYLEIFDNMQVACDEVGAQLIIVFPTNKASIYGEDYLPDRFPKINEQSRLDMLVEYLDENSDVDIIYPKARFLDIKDQYQLYCKLDTHWNNAGAYTCFTQIADRYGEKGVLQLNDMSIATETSTMGDLVNMIQVEGLTDTQYFIPYKDDITFAEIVQDQVSEVMSFRFESSNSNGKKLMMYCDSYSIALLPFLVKDFECSYFERTRVFNKDKILEEKPDVVIYQVLERYVYSVQDLPHVF